VGLVPDEKKGVVTASSKELGNMRRSWAVGEVLINGGSRL
jgi:hypothetical protein